MLFALFEAITRVCKDHQIGEDVLSTVSADTSFPLLRENPETEYSHLHANMVRKGKDTVPSIEEHPGGGHIAVTAQQSRYALDAVDAPASKEV